jgi:hypothetical protein
MYKPHSAFETPGNMNMKLWRYMDGRNEARFNASSVRPLFLMPGSYGRQV